MTRNWRGEPAETCYGCGSTGTAAGVDDETRECRRCGVEYAVERQTPSSPTLGADQAALVRALERAGWRLINFEIDFHRATARVELRGTDGRNVTLDARNGRATLTREHVFTKTHLIGRRGDKCRVERLHTEFLGRSTYPGLRSGMRSLANYIADNAPLATLPRQTARRLLAPTLDSWDAPTRNAPTGGRDLLVAEDGADFEALILEEQDDERA